MAPGRALSWGGTLTTASGLVIFGEEGGSLMAADAMTGKPLWSFETNHTWKSSPMTYMFDGKQYVAVAAGSNIIALAIASACSPKHALGSKRSADVFFTPAALGWGFLNEPLTYGSGPRYLARQGR